MSTKSILLVFTIMIFFISCFSLFPNPLLGNSDRKANPSIRPPSSQGFMVDEQLEFRDKIGDVLLEIKESSNKTLLWGLMGLAFLYGVLHAAGPGHRKTVIFSMFLTRKANWQEPLYAAFMSSSAHAGSALLLMFIYQMAVKQIKPGKIAITSQYMEGITYSLLFLFALFFVGRITIRLIMRIPHSHHPVSGRGLYSTLLVSSFFPCPGVIMILTFSVSLGVFSLGILAVIALSLGMGVTISIVGYLAFTGREGLFLALKGHEHAVGKISAVLELGSFVFLSLFSFWMVYPFLSDIFFS